MSPFRSKAQMRKFGSLVSKGKMSQTTFDEWMGATQKAGGVKNLPNRIAKKKPAFKKKKK